MPYRLADAMPSRGGRTRLRSVMLPLDPGVLGRLRVKRGSARRENKAVFSHVLSMAHFRLFFNPRVFYDSVSTR